MEGTYVWQEIHLAMGEIRNQFLAVNEAVDLLNRRAADEVVSATRRTRSTVLISSVSGAGFLLLWGLAFGRWIQRSLSGVTARVRSAAIEVTTVSGTVSEAGTPPSL